MSALTVVASWNSCTLFQPNPPSDAIGSPVSSDSSTEKKFWTAC